MAGDVGRGEDVELRQHRILVLQRHLLAVAQRPRGSREGGGLLHAREQAVVVRHDAHRADARPVRLDRAGVALVARVRDRSQVAGGVERVVLVVERVHRRLVRHDEDVAETGELRRHRRDVNVAHQDVLVLFLHQLEAGRNDDLDHVLARRQHPGAVRHPDAGRAVRARRLAGGRIGPGVARELVHAVIRRRLRLVQLRPAVVALELGVVRDRRLRVGAIEPLRAVLQRREERARRVLPRTVHVGDHRPSVGPQVKALGPVVPAGRPGRVHPFQRLLAVGGRAFLVQVDRHARNAGLPRQLKQQRRVVERPGRGVDHVAADAAVFGGQRRIVAAGRNRIGERLHAELDERILAEQALPAHRRSPGQRRIDAAAGQKGRRRIGSRRPGRSEVIGTVLDRGARAIRMRAVHGARVAQIHRKRSLLDRIGQAGGDRGVAGAGLARAVDGAAGVIHHVRAGRLVARGIGLDDQPVHEREHLVPAGEAVQVGVVEEAEAAIAIADVGGHQRQAGLERVAAAVHVGNAVAIAVDEGPGEQVRAPLRGREFEAIGRRGTRRIGATSQRAGRPADMDGRHQAVQHDVVPLIEHRQHPVALRDALEVEVSIGIALGKPEGRTVGLADRHVALREAVVGVVAAAVGALVRRAAHVRVGDAAVHVGRALGRGRRIADPAVRAVVPALVDHLRIRESDRDVESARPELLEVARLVGFDESLVRLAAVQGIGLQPLLASADAVRGRHGLDLIQPRVQVVDDRLTLQRRHRHAIGLEVRAGRDHSDDAVGPGRDRAGVQAGDRIDRPRQRVRQRLVEHVVGRLARVVAEAAGLVEQHDVEAAQARLVRRERVDTAAGIVLAVQRLVVLEDEHGDLSGRQRRALQLDIDGGHVAQTAIGAVGGNLGAGDLRATHRVAAVSNADRKAGTVAHARGLARHVGNDVAGVGVDRSAGREPPLRSVPEADRSALTVQGRVDAVGRHHRQVVVLGRIEVDHLATCLD